MRRALACTLPLALLAACRVGGDGAKETITWKGPVGDGARVALRLRDGRVTVEEGTGDSAEGVLTVTRRTGKPSVTLQVVQDARGIVACVQYEAEARCDADAYAVSAATGGRSVTAVLRLPRGRSLDIATDNSPITVDAPSAAAVLRTGNGRIRVRDVAGPLVVTTSNASVRATGTRGAVSIETSNGAIRLVPDSVGGDVTLVTSNGSVETELPASASAALRAQTSNGAIEFALPGTIRARESGSLDAVLGAGTHRFTVTTSNGRVAFKARGNGSDSGDDN